MNHRESPSTPPSPPLPLKSPKRADSIHLKRGDSVVSNSANTPTIAQKIMQNHATTICCQHSHVVSQPPPPPPPPHTAAATAFLHQESQVVASNTLKLAARITQALLANACLISLFLVGFQLRDMVDGGAWFSKPSFLMFTTFTTLFISIILVFDSFLRFSQRLRVNAGLSVHFSHLVVLV